MDFSNYKTLSPGYTTRLLRTEYPTLFRLCGTIIFNAVPVIYNTSHLSVLVGYKEYIKAALHTKYFYRDFEVVKNGKKKRYI
jgi:RNA-directed DNA polymerase